MASYLNIVVSILIAAKILRTEADCERRPRNRNTFTHPNLIIPTSFRKISHPFYTSVVARLKNLQEAYNEPRCCEHQHLKLNIDWGSSPDLSCSRSCQIRGCPDSTLLATLQSGNPGHFRKQGISQTPKTFQCFLLPNNDIF